MLILCSFQEDFIEREWRGGERGDMVSEAPSPPTPSYWECFSTFCQQTILHGWHYLTAEPEDARLPRRCCPCCTCPACTEPESMLNYSVTNLSEPETLHSSTHQTCSTSQTNHNHSNGQTTHTETGPRDQIQMSTAVCFGPL